MDVLPTGEDVQEPIEGEVAPAEEQQEELAGAGAEEQAVEEAPVEPEVQPVYGAVRYAIVDDVIRDLEQSELEKANFSAVRNAAERAQAPYMTTSMKELGSSYAGPPKYLS